MKLPGRGLGWGQWGRCWWAGCSPALRGAARVPGEHPLPQSPAGNIRPGPAGRALGPGQAAPERTWLILVGPMGRNWPGKELAWNGTGLEWN